MPARSESNEGFSSEKQWLYCRSPNSRWSKNDHSFAQRMRSGILL